MNEKIAMLTFEQFWGRKNIGSSRIRGRWLIKYWDKLEKFKVGEKYDAVIFQKAYWVDYAKLYKGIKILDICDADFMDWHYRIKELVDECDAVVTSTPALAKEMQIFIKEKPVICIPDRIDLEAHQEKKEHKGNAKWAIWFGYSTNFYLLQGIERHLQKLGLGLIVISDKNYTITGNYKVELLNIRWNEETLNENLLKGDIVLNPFSSKARWRFKSNNKTLTSWALGLPVATTPEELERFMSEEERKKEAIVKQKEIKEKWDIKLSIPAYEILINHIKKNRNESISLSK